MNIKMIAGCALLAGVTTTFYLYSGAAGTATAADTPAPMAGLQGRGQGVLRFWGLAIYEARLWVSPGFAAQDYAALPLALELTYQRAFTAQAIAQRSIEEMRRVGNFSPEQGARWQQALQATLPDVQPGDLIAVPGTGACPARGAASGATAGKFSAASCSAATSAGGRRLSFSVMSTSPRCQRA